ncbi:MAG: hypothetical protein AAGF77_01980 [Bacteroidota bacterium]
MRHLFYLLAIALLHSCSQDDPAAQQPPADFAYAFTKYKFSHTFEATTTNVPYSFFKPQQAYTSTTEFPLVVALHGTEFHVSTEEDFLSEALKTAGFMMTTWIEENIQQQYPAYVLAPNIHSGIFDLPGYNSWEDVAAQALLVEMLDLITTSHQIDTDRIYFVGHSIGGGAVWKLSGALKERIAAIVPLSHGLGAAANADPIINDISNGVYDDISIWNIVHIADFEGSIRTARPIFKHLQNLGLNPVITHTLDTQESNLTSTAIGAAIEAGQSYFYTEHNFPCEGAACHYSWVTDLEGQQLYQWLFRQRKEE